MRVRLLHLGFFHHLGFFLLRQFQRVFVDYWLESFSFSFVLSDLYAQHLFVPDLLLLPVIYVP